jgi:hypothetical protein
MINRRYANSHYSLQMVYDQTGGSETSMLGHDNP